MKKSQVLFLMISISVMTLIGREVFDRFSGPNIARAQSTQPAQFGAQTKWEYCEIERYSGYRESFGVKVYSTIIRYYIPSGWRIETVELDHKDGGSNDKVEAKAIAKLGEEGWEMVHDRTSEGTTTKIYFKRPKQ
jgi:hypothetical protein